MTNMKKRVLAMLMILVMCAGVWGNAYTSYAVNSTGQETAGSTVQTETSLQESGNPAGNDKETTDRAESSAGKDKEIAERAESSEKKDKETSESEPSAKQDTEAVKKPEQSAKDGSETEPRSEDPTSEVSDKTGKAETAAASETEKKESETATVPETEADGVIFEDPVKVSSDYASVMKLDSIKGDPVPLDEEQIYNLEYNNYDIPINYSEGDTRWAKNIYVAYCSVSPDNFRPNDITYLEEMMDPANDELFGTKRSLGFGSLYDLGELNGYYAVYTGASRRNSRDIDGYALYALADGNTVELSGSVFDAKTDMLLIPYEVYEKYKDHDLFVTMVQIREGTAQSSGDTLYTGRNSSVIRLQTSPGSTAEAQYSFTTNSNDQTMYWGGAFTNPKTGDEVGGSGSYLYRYKAKSADGTLMKMTFCLEPGAHLFTGDQLSNSQGHIKWNKLSTEQKDAIRYIIYKYAHHSLDVDCNNDEKWVACQALVWEIAMELRNPETFVRTGTRVYNNYLAHKSASVAKAAYDEMAAHIKDNADRIKTTTYDGEFDFYATASRQLIFAGTSIKSQKAGINFEITKKCDTASDSKALAAASSKYSLKGAEYSAYEIPDVKDITDAKTKGFMGRDKSDPSSASTNSSGVASLTLPSILDKDHPRAAYIIYETASSPYYRLDRTVYLLYLHYDSSENKITYRLYSIPWSARKTATASTWTTHKDATTISTTAIPKTTVYETPKRFKLKLVKKLEDGAVASGSYTLEGAEYKLYYSDKYYDSKVLYGTYKTNAKGEIEFGELPMHQAYYVQESKPSAGCELDDTIYLVHLEDGDNDTYYYYCKYSSSVSSDGKITWKNSPGFDADDGSTLEKSATIVKTVTVTSEEPLKDEFRLKIVKRSTGTGVAGINYSREAAVYTIYAADRPKSDSTRTATLDAAFAGVSGSTNLDRFVAAAGKGKVKVVGSVKTDAEGRIAKVYTGANGTGTASDGTEISLPISGTASGGNGQYYYMIESTAPPAYQRDDHIFAISVRTNADNKTVYDVYKSADGADWELVTDTTAGEVGTITAEDAQIPVKILLKKVSANPGYPETGDQDYSLKDAEYTLYYGCADVTDQKLADGWKVKKKIASAKTGAEFTLEFENLTALKQNQGFYYIQETKASKGFETDPTIWGIIIRPGDDPETLTYRVYESENGEKDSFKQVQNVNNVPSGSVITVTSEEPPIYRPLEISLTKYDKETGTPVAVPDEKLAAVFQLEYFNVTPGTAIDGRKADKTWRFRTDKAGSMALTKERLDTSFKNSDLEYNADGVILFPEGTYRMTEVQAPDGYTLENGIMQFGEGGSFTTSSNVLGYDVQNGIPFTIRKDQYGQPFIYYTDDTAGTSSEIAVENLKLSAYDELDKCSVKIIKYKQGTKTVLQGVTFKLVSEKGEEYVKTTDSKGEILFDELRRGKYVLTETDGPDGMQMLKESITIELPVTMTEEDVKKGNVDTSKAMKRIIKDTTGKDVVQYVFRDVTYKVGNSYNMDMPMTGGNDWMQVMIGMMGMALILVCAWKGSKMWKLKR